MQGMWLSVAVGLALAATALTPVHAGSSGEGLSNSGGRPGVLAGRPDATPGHRDGRHHGRGHRDFGGSVIVRDWADGDWGRYNNRTFDAESYNDWWHERPWRSYPRWVTEGSCDRVWWGGGSWRCAR